MRYAVYVTPARDSDLASSAAAWLGRDAFSGASVTRPSGLLPAEIDVDRITADPRRYGFHGTLKAPFHLREDATEQDLVQATHDLAARMQGFTVPEMVIGRLGPFFALIPADQNADLQALCNACVTELERFRAPLSDADISRRDPQSLSIGQRANLMTWGYPYVFDEFRFHMTLTGPVADPDRAKVEAALKSHFHHHHRAPMIVDRTAIFVEQERGMAFTVLADYPLS